VTNRPTGATTAGRANLELRRLARARNRPTAELLQLYALEGFLARLPASPHAHRLVLKGGVLLAAFDARRPTKDIDLAARDLANALRPCAPRSKPFLRSHSTMASNSNPPRRATANHPMVTRWSLMSDSSGCFAATASRPDGLGSR
jgi:hypothetical protein